MRKIQHVFLIVAMVLAVSCSTKYPTYVQELDKTLSMRDVYTQAFENKVEQIRITLGRTNDSLQIYDLQDRLAREYIHTSFDTTQIYLSSNLKIACELGNDNLIQQSRIWLAYNYALSAYYQEAYSLLDSIEPEQLSGNLKSDYYIVKVVGARRLRNYAPTLEYSLQNQQELESLLVAVEPLLIEDSYMWNYVQWEKSRNREDYLSGISLALKLVDSAEKGTYEYSEAAFYTALSYKDIDDEENYIRWLCISAQNDIRIAARTDFALISLSHYFVRTGDLNKGYHYVMDIAFPDAVKMNSRYNMFTLFGTVQRLTKSNEEIFRANKRRIIIGIIVLALLSVCLTVTIFILRRRNVALHSTHAKLRSANIMKEKYITSFLTLMAKNAMNHQRSLVHSIKMLRQGRQKELLGEFELEQEEMDNPFTQRFDTTFLDLYPDFVARFNELLKPGEQIVPQGDRSLTPELRIYALMKLGVTDLQEVGVLLHYAPSTIYNYRVKVLSRTLLGKKEFEERIRSI